jgi:hypothetical protein
VSSTWWSLPGPANFVDRVADSLRTGRSCAVLLTALTPRGLREAIRRCSDELHNRWQRLLLDSSEAIVPALFESYANEEDNGRERTLANLAEMERFQNRIIWCEVSEAIAAKAWASFLQDYEPLARSLPLTSRTVFCLALSGDAALAWTIGEEAGLTIERYCGCITPLDSQIHAAQLLWGRKLKPLVQEIAARVLAEVCVWDCFAAEELSERPIEHILEPASFLEEVQTSRGWSGVAEMAFVDAWAMGAADEYAGQRLFHPAALSLQQMKRECSRASWSAELGAVWPLIERRREEVIRALGDKLRVPYTTREGATITNREDLELGHIQTLLFDKRHSLFELYEKIDFMRGLRNDLAHNRPIPLSTMLSSKLEALNGWHP